jgi:hypothetical protein
MIPIRSNFHKIIYKRVRFSPNFIFTLGKGINIFLKIKPILTMLVLKNLKIAGYLLLVLTNHILYNLN